MLGLAGRVVYKFLRLFFVAINVFSVCLNGRVNVVIGEKEQEGIFLIPIFEEADGFLSQAFSQILSFLFGFKNRVCPWSIVTSRRSSSVMPANIDIEALVSRPMPLIS